MNERKQETKKGGKNLSAIFICCLIVATYVGYNFFGLGRTINNSPATGNELTKKNLVHSKPSASLGEAVNGALSGTHGTYGVVIKNLKTGETYFSNEHRIFEPASVYKLWVMGTVFEEIEQGKINEEETLSANVSDLNREFDIPESGAERTEGVVSFSVREALFSMITVSDNYAALLLTDKVGLGAISSFLESHGFKESKVGVNGKSPTTTAFDTALFLERLYEGSLADKKYTQEMISLLKAQKLNDALPKYLPDDVIVAHKTGAMDNFTHDVGIVFSDKGDYVIVVFSKSDSRDQANERIAGVSEAVWKYFSK